MRIIRSFLNSTLDADLRGIVERDQMLQALREIYDLRMGSPADEILHQATDEELAEFVKVLRET